MKAVFIILGILLLASSSGVIYLTVENNKNSTNPDITQIVLNSIAALMGIIVAILCFLAARGKKGKDRKKKHKFK